MAQTKKNTEPAIANEEVSFRMTAALKARQSQGARVAFRITGNAPLLMHRWSQKAVMQMLGKMRGSPLPREAKDMIDEYENSYYRNTDGDVVLPCRVLKAAIVEGAITTNKVVTKADLKRSLRVCGFTAPIHVPKGGEVRQNIDIVRVNDQPDVRSRALVPAGYYFDVVIEFPTAILNPDQVAAAMLGAGSSIGLCEKRPEKGGDFGTFDFEVLEEKEHARIMRENALAEETYNIPDEFLRAAKTTTASIARKAGSVVERVRKDSQNGAAVAHGDAE